MALKIVFKKASFRFSSLDTQQYKLQRLQFFGKLKMVLKIASKMLDVRVHCPNAMSRE